MSDSKERAVEEAGIDEMIANINAAEDLLWRLDLAEKELDEIQITAGDAVSRVRKLLATWEALESLIVRAEEERGRLRARLKSKDPAWCQVLITPELWDSLNWRRGLPRECS